MPFRSLLGAIALLAVCHVVTAAEPPEYADKSRLLFFIDGNGTSQPVKTPADWSVRADHVRAHMQRVMGPLPEASRAPLDVAVVSETTYRHYTRRHLTFAVEKDDRLPAYLLIPHGPDGKPPRDGKLPAMICLPPSAAPGKDTPAGLTPVAELAYAHELAERGYVCVVLDYPLLHAREYKTDPYNLGYASATMKGVVNHRRAVDLLRSLPFVDAEAVGVIGHSLGGHNALFLAAFDPRVKAVVSSCGFNVFAKHNKGNLDAWSSRYYMPRIKTDFGNDPRKVPFDFTEVLAILAPRPVFVNAPLRDEPDFEVSGVRDCIDAALPVYREVFDAAGHLRVEYPDAGHNFPAAVRQGAYDFLDRHLKKDAGKVDVQSGLVAQWKLTGDVADSSGNRHDLKNHGVAVDGDATFDGRGTRLEGPSLRLGKGDFSITARIQADGPGDFLSQYDPVRRRGFHLTLKTNAVAGNQANVRQLQFGIDDNKESGWRDCGRPGKAVLAFGLATHEGALYAGTCEPGKDEAGRVYRYLGGQEWIDCGAPDRCNAVHALAVHEGKLYCGTGKYRLAGSALPESENVNLGGRVFRYDGGTKWVDCGQVPGTEAVASLAVFRGKLYASSLYKPAGFYRYEGGTKWTDCGTPNGRRVEAMAVFNDHLYATCYDEGHVFRYDGKEWADCGQLGDAKENTQTYSFAVHQGRLLTGTWRSGRVYRFEGLGKWTDLGRLGEELEVMGMLTHNGRLLAGSLPSAEVYSFEGDKWRRLASLDQTPDVKYRRAWSMAEHQGCVFVSTLPSGRVFSFEAGRSVTRDHELKPGWHHVAAVKGDGRLSLFVDGQLVGRSAPFDTDEFDLTTDRPLQVGFGESGFFQGRMRDVRVYGRALNAAEVRELAR